MVERSRSVPILIWRIRKVVLSSCGGHRIDERVVLDELDIEWKGQSPESTARDCECADPLWQRKYGYV